MSCDTRDFSKYYVNGMFSRGYAVNFGYVIHPFIFAHPDYFSLTYDFILYLNVYETIIN